MPKKLMHGESKRFQVVSDWYSPQGAAYELLDNGTRLLRVEDDNKDVRAAHLAGLCDLLNELAGESEATDGK